MKTIVFLLALMLAAAPAIGESSNWQEVERLRGDGKVKESLELAEALRATGTPSMELDREYALSLNAAGRKDDAISVLEKYKTQPLNASTATAINTLGWIYLTRGIYSEAISTFEIITTSTSFNFEENRELSGKAFNNLGYTLTLVGRTEEAKGLFQKAVSYGNANANANLASINATSKAETVKKISSVDRSSAAKAINSFLDRMDGFDEGGATDRKKAREGLVAFVKTYGHADLAVDEVIRRLEKRMGPFKTNQGMINGMTALLDLHASGSLGRSDLTKIIAIGKKLQKFNGKPKKGDRDSTVVADTASKLVNLSY